MKLAAAALVAAAVLAHAGHAAADGYTITGIVKWKGAAPERPPLDRMSDPVCAANPRASEDVVVAKGRVRDVLVRIKVGTAGTHRHPVPTAPVVIVQDQCMYGPRVVGLVEGQPLEVRNGDPTFHNVRGNRDGKVVWNLAQPAAAPAITRTDLGKPGDIVDLHCDVHPWMAGWVAVHDHPYFAVTGADGAFVIANVPAGTYTLEAWHPVLGLTSKTIRVKRGKAPVVSFTLAAPKAAATKPAAKR